MCSVMSFGRVIGSCCCKDSCISLVMLLFVQHDAISVRVCRCEGAAIYVARVPERWWPGKFDLWSVLSVAVAVV